MRTSTRNRLSLQALALLIACLGALLVFISSVWGIGVSPDSAEYIISARRLDSFSVLFTFPSHWGPGYPVLLAFAHLFADDILLTTRLLQCLLFAANLYLATWLMMQVADNRQSLSMVLASTLFLVSFTTYNIHFFAWSEGPLILLQLISASCLLGYWQRNSLPMLVAAAALAGLALLFRYAGIAWIGASGLLLLCMGQGNFARRFRMAFIYGAVALGPFILWLLANHFLRDETTNREFLVHLVSLQDIKTLLLLVFSWFGGRYGPALFAVEAALAISVLYLAFRRSGAPAVTFVRFGILASVYIAVYTAFILFAKSFMDAYIPLDDRIFVPVYVFLFLLLAASAIRLLQQDDVRQKVLAAAMILSLLGSNALSLKPVVSAYIATGTGYLSGYMASLPSLREVPLLRGARVYSNASDYVRLMTDLDAVGYPRKFEPTRQLRNEHYAEDLDAMRTVVEARDAYLVHYLNFEGRSYYPTLAELLEAGFVVLMDGRGVVVMGSGEAAAAEITSPGPENADDA